MTRRTESIGCQEPVKRYPATYRDLVTVEGRLELKPTRERSVLRRHPWIMSGAVGRIAGDPRPGDTVLVTTADGEPLGHAAYSPESSIRARMWSFDPERPIDETHIAERIAAAIARRNGLLPNGDSARLVFAEADDLPGLVVDRYGDTVVMQCNTVGADRWRDTFADALAELPGVSCVVERSDSDSRSREGLSDRSGIVRGRLPERVWAVEGERRYVVDVEHGHKTGFYLDQRDGRAMLASQCAGRRVLNVFGYTGSFSVVAAVNGASTITTIDSSGPALDIARRNGEANGVDVGELVEADAFTELRRLRDRRAQFDVVLLDPPKLAAGSGQVDKATRAYKDINLLGTKLLAPGGLLFTWSCSGAVTAELFRKVVAGAAADAKRDLRVVARLGQPADHPVPLAFPEAEYLKGLVLRAD